MQVLGQRQAAARSRGASEHHRVRESRSDGWSPAASPRGSPPASCRSVGNRPTNPARRPWRPPPRASPCASARRTARRAPAPAPSPRAREDRAAPHARCPCGPGRSRPRLRPARRCRVLRASQHSSNSSRLQRPASITGCSARRRSNASRAACRSASSDRRGSSCATRSPCAVTAKVFPSSRTRRRMRERHRFASAAEIVSSVGQRFSETPSCLQRASAAPDDPPQPVKDLPLGTALRPDARAVPMAVPDVGASSPASASWSAASSAAQDAGVRCGTRTELEPTQRSPPILTCA